MILDFKKLNNNKSGQMFKCLSWVFLLIALVIIVLFFHFKSYTDSKAIIIKTKSKENFVTDVSDFIEVNVLPQADRLYVLGTAGDVSLYYTLGKELGKLYPIKPIITVGSVDNINLLKNRKIDFGFSQEDRLYDAVNGQSNFFGNPQRNLRFICAFYSEVYTLITSRGDINTWGDLKGKKVSFGPKTLTSYQDGIDMTGLIGLKPGKDYTLVDSSKPTDPFKYARDINKFVNGELDAILFTIGHWHPFVNKLSKLMPIRFVSTDDIPGDLIRYRFQTSRPNKINIGQYAFYNRGTSGPLYVDTWGGRVCLVCNDDMPEKVVYDMTKLIFDHVEKLRLSHPFLDSLTHTEMAYTDYSIPIHKGAEKYYREKGYINDIGDPNCKFLVGKMPCTKQTLEDHNLLEEPLKPMPEPVMFPNEPNWRQGVKYYKYGQKLEDQKIVKDFQQVQYDRGHNYRPGDGFV